MFPGLSVWLSSTSKRQSKKFVALQVDDEKFEYEKFNFLAVMPEKLLIPLPQPEVPERIQMSFHRPHWPHS